MNMNCWMQRFKINFKLEPELTALLIIDMQNASACRTEGIGRLFKDTGKSAMVEWRFSRIEKIVLPNLVRMLTFFRQHRLKVLHIYYGSVMDNYRDIPIFIRQVAQRINNRVGTKVNKILTEVEPQPGEPVIRKSTESAFMSSSIDRVLKNLGIKYLLFGGVSTNSCIDGTARNAAELDYHCIIIDDCCAAVSESMHQGALDNFSFLPGFIKSTEEIIYELSKRLSLRCNPDNGR